MMTVLPVTPDHRPHLGRQPSSWLRRPDVRWLGLILTLYLAAGIPLAARCVNQIDNDGVSYLRLAGYYAQGHLSQAINGYWGPLLSWLMAPLIAVGVSPLAAARTVLLASGLALTVGAWLFLGRLGLSRLARRAATICVAVMAVSNSVRTLSPDLLLAAILAFYFWLALDENLLERRSLAFKCGLVIGLGYLAKAYALPFFALHLPVTCLLHQWLGKAGARGQIGRTIALACAGVAILVLPWAMVISIKYGRPTVSTAGPIIHRIFGPAPGRKHFSEQGLWQPRGEALSRGEDPSLDPDKYPDWGPLRNVAMFKHQLALVREGLHYFMGVVAGASRWHIVPGALLGIFILALFAGGRQPQALVSCWLVWTSLAYPTGLVWVAAGGAARYYWVLGPVFVGLTFYLVQFLATAGGRGPVTEIPRSKWLFALVVVTAAFVLIPAQRVVRAWRNPPSVGVRAVAERMAALPLPGPLAVNKGYEGYWLSYLLDVKYLGHPLAQQPAALLAELQSAGTGTFLIWDDEELDRALAAHAKITHLATITGEAELAGRRLSVYAVPLLPAALPVRKPTPAPER